MDKVLTKKPLAPRFVVVSEYFYPDNSGGTPTDLSELIASLKSAMPEASIDVITSRNLYRWSGAPVALPRREVWSGVAIRRLRTPCSNRRSTGARLLAGLIFSGQALIALSFRKRYSGLIIVTNPPANGLLGYLYSCITGVPYIYIVHDLYPDIAVAMGVIRRGALASLMFHNLQKAWLNKATYVVVLGRCMKDYLRENYDVRLSRISVIPSWGSSDSFTTGNNGNTFKMKEGLSGFIVLYAGNFSGHINFNQILGAAKALLEVREITFVLIGDGTQRAQIESVVLRDRLSNVRVLKKVPKSEMRGVLAGANVAIVPLARSMLGLGVPSKFYTILMAGRPVIALVPHGCEIARIVDEEQCGVSVSEDSVESLVGAVLALKMDPNRTARFGANARRAAESRFTLGRSTQEFVATIDGLAVRGGPVIV